MRFATYSNSATATADTPAIALQHNGELLGLPDGERHRLPVDMLTLLQGGMPALRSAEAIFRQFGRPLDEQAITFLPPIVRPPKIICVGLNFLDHTKESNFEQPKYPTLFGRFASSMIGHQQAIIRPQCSEQLDYEGEMVAVIGKGGRHITPGAALDHVIGYSICNDASIRDYQFKSPQWTVGKNFDGTGAFGPYLVSADEVPAGGKGLRLQTRLNGETVQSANISDMVFDVANLVSLLSEAMTLEVGDVIIAGTPSGVGLARKPALWMKHGDLVEVEIEGLGILRNLIADEVLPTGR